MATNDLQLIERALHWPPDHVFPGIHTNTTQYQSQSNTAWYDLYVVVVGIDILRLALLNQSGSKYFVGDDDSGKVFLGELLALAV